MPVSNSSIYLKVEIKPEDETSVIPKVLCNFSYSLDGSLFKPIGKTFVASEGHWVGAKIGIVSLAPQNTIESGFADFDWFRVTP